MSWEDEQKMYRRLRKRKYSPTDAVRKIRDFNLRKTLKKAKTIPKKMKKGKFKGKIKTRHVKYRYDGDDENIGMEELMEPIGQEYPENVGIDLGFSQNRRDVASEAAIRETDRIANGVRSELRNTGQQLHVVSKKKTPNRPLRNWLGRVGRTAIGGAKETYPKVRHPIRAIDLEADQKLKEMEQKYGSLTPVYVPEEDIVAPNQSEEQTPYQMDQMYPEQFETGEMDYSRRKRGKKRKTKSKVRKFKKSKKRRVVKHKKTKKKRTNKKRRK